MPYCEAHDTCTNRTNESIWLLENSAAPATHLLPFATAIFVVHAFSDVSRKLQMLLLQVAAPRVTSSELLCGVEACMSFPDRDQ